MVGEELIAGDVAVDGGVISAVGLPGGDTGLLAVPGFVDVHFHGYGGHEFADATAEEFAEIARRIPATGVTALQPTLWTMPMDDTLTALRRHPGAVDGGARLLGFHMEGPFLAPGKAGAHDRDLLLLPDPDVVARYLDSGPVAQVTLAPELSGSLETISYLVGRGVVVSLGHSLATAEETALALKAGAGAFTHVFNAMRPFDHRDPGILGAALADQEAFLTGIFDGVHFAEEAARTLIRCAGDRLVAITDGTAATSTSAPTVRLGGVECAIVDGAPRQPDGTIAGSILTMDSALRNLISLGLDITEAIRAVSTAPARLARRQDLGLLGVGSVADVVVLDESLEVVRTLVGGVEVFHRA